MTSMADAVDALGSPPTNEPNVRVQPGVSHTASRRASDIVSDNYRMNHSYRGGAVIINNKKFQPKTRMNIRTGTDADADAMYKLLDTLGFEDIDTLNDLTAADIKRKLTEASTTDRSNHDCFVCIILSHGDDGYVYGIDEKIAIDELVLPFKGNKCPSLAGKPKLFFIQACRGDKLDAGIDVADAAGEDEEGLESYRIPAEADFLFAYSTVPGFYSWRNEGCGSWFIQAVAKVFHENWTEMELLKMMTRVNKMVAYDFESNTSNELLHKKKQIPCFTSTLTKEVYFKRE